MAAPSRPLGRRDALELLDLDLDVAVVARRAPVVEPEADVAVVPHQLGRLDLDVGQALPAPLAEAEELLPAVVHGQPATLLAGQHLTQAHRRADLIEDLDPVAVRDTARLRLVRVDVNDRYAALEPQHVAVVAPRRMDRPAPVRRVPE